MALGEGPPRDPLIPSAAPSADACEQADARFKDAPRCHRVGGSDDNTELSAQSHTRVPALLNGTPHLAYQASRMAATP